MADLSPAAQAVMKAAAASYWDEEYEVASPAVIAAAALRAAADQVQMDKPLGSTDADAGVFAAHHAISAQLLAIAAELEQS
jgi:hypothetical protein